MIEAQACGPPPDQCARPATWQALSSRLRLNELPEYGQGGSLSLTDEQSLALCVDTDGTDSLRQELTDRVVRNRLEVLVIQPHREELVGLQDADYLDRLPPAAPGQLAELRPGRPPRRGTDRPGAPIGVPLA
jgi:hypothetical protein